MNDKDTHIEKIIDLLGEMSPQAEEKLRCRLNDRYWCNQIQELKEHIFDHDCLEAPLDAVHQQLKENFASVEKVIEQAGIVETTIKRRLTGKPPEKEIKKLDQDLLSQQLYKSQLEQHREMLQKHLERFESSKNVLIARARAARACIRNDETIKATPSDIYSLVEGSSHCDSKKNLESFMEDDDFDYQVIDKRPTVVRSDRLIHEVTAWIDCTESVVEGYEELIQSRAEDDK